MKATCKYITVLLIPLSILLPACKKSTVPTPVQPIPTNCVAIGVETEDLSSKTPYIYGYKIIYDPAFPNRPGQILWHGNLPGNQLDYYFTYTGDTVLRTTRYAGSATDLGYRWIIKNSQGYPELVIDQRSATSTSKDVYMYAYDNQNQLKYSLTLGNTDTIFYKWGNGDISQVLTPWQKYYGTGYEYYDTLAPTNDYFNIGDLIGYGDSKVSRSAHLLKRDIFLYMHSTMYNYSYDIDAGGYVRAKYQKYNSGANKYVTTYSYDCD